MSRTREAALDGAVRAIAKYGSRKATMGDIAMIAGIAKATLYNHFRTRDDVYRAVVEAEVATICERAAVRVPDGFGCVLLEAASLIAAHPALRRIAADEPALIAALATIDDGPVWSGVRACVGETLRRCGLADGVGSVDVVLRYLASQLFAPAVTPLQRSSCELLSSMLPAADVVLPEARHAPAAFDPLAASVPAGSAGTNS